MPRFVIAVCCVLCCFGAFPRMTSAQNWQCHALDDYPELAIGAFPDDDRGYDLIIEFNESDEPFVTMQRYELRYLSGVMYEWADTLDDISISTIPLAAREYHDSMVDTIYLLGDVAYDVSNGKEFMKAMWDNDVDEVYLANAEGRKTWSRTLWR